ncbi:hypothetical protein POF50_021680 [Streptomyces sp. SL13]|uniref:Uncharacterized protein n=1 Tax=Streptantibioticus silvisoli TaxID=2705255 RepID=A0AA90H7E3_9ACTN|nr:hypothetical protein [Streptantibioticus silvisoli]MDI5971912.1 hypothetical protein [Streptantibioticus silvisoli]
MDVNVIVLYVLPLPLFFIFVIVMGLRAKAKGLRRRKEYLAAQWHQLQAAVAHGRSEGAHLLQVVQVYQKARTGSKAIITWCDSGQQQDAWFANQYVADGQFLLVRAASGYGPHTGNPNVLFVHPQDVRASADPWAAHAAAALRKR